MSKREVILVTGTKDRPTSIGIDDSGEVIDLWYGFASSEAPNTGDQVNVYALLPEGLYVGHEVAIRRLPTPKGITVAPNSPIIGLVASQVGDGSDYEHGFVPNAAAAAVIRDFVTSLADTAWQGGATAASAWDVGPHFTRAPMLSLENDIGLPTLVSPAFVVLKWMGKDWLVVTCTNSVQLVDVMPD